MLHQCNMTSLCCIVLFRQWRPVIISQISRFFGIVNAFLCKDVSMSRMLFWPIGSIAGHFCRPVSSAGCFRSVACWKWFCELHHISPQGLAVISPSFSVLMNLQSLTLPSCSTVRMVLSTQGVWFAPHMTCCTGVQCGSHQSSSIGSHVVTVSSLLLGNSSWNVCQIYELWVCVCVCCWCLTQFLHLCQRGLQVLLRSRTVDLVDWSLTFRQA